MGHSSERIRMRTLFLLSALSSALAAPFFGSGSGSSMRSGSAPDYSGYGSGPDYGSADYGSGSMRSGSAPDYSGSAPDYASEYGSGSMRSGSAPDYSGYGSGPDYGSADYGSGSMRSGSAPDYS